MFGGAKTQTRLMKYIFGFQVRVLVQCWTYGQYYCLLLYITMVDVWAVAELVAQYYSISLVLFMEEVSSSFKLVIFLWLRKMGHKKVYLYVFLTSGGSFGAVQKHLQH